MYLKDNELVCDEFGPVSSFSNLPYEDEEEFEEDELDTEEECNYEFLFTEGEQDIPKWKQKLQNILERSDNMPLQF